MLPAKIYYSEKIQNKINKGQKIRGVKSGRNRNQIQSYKNLVQVESHEMHLIPPASNDDNICEVFSTKEAH